MGSVSGISGSDRILTFDGTRVRHEAVAEVQARGVDGNIKTRVLDGDVFKWGSVNAITRLDMDMDAVVITTEYNRRICIAECACVGTGRGREIDTRRAGEFTVGLKVVLEGSLELPCEAPVVAKIWESAKGDHWSAGSPCFYDWVSVCDVPGKDNRTRNINRKMRLNGMYGPYVKAVEYKDCLENKEAILYMRGRGNWCRSHIPVRALAYLLGFYVGNGWTSKATLDFSVNKADMTSFMSHLEGLKKFALINESIRTDTGEAFEVRFGNRFLMDYFMESTRGSRAWNKNIPDVAFLMGDEDLNEFLLGLHESDGNLGKSSGGAYYYTTTSPHITHQLCELYKRKSAMASVYVKRAEGEIDNASYSTGRECYTVYCHTKQLRGASIKRARDSVGLNGVCVPIKSILRSKINPTYTIITGIGNGIVVNGVLACEV